MNNENSFDDIIRQKANSHKVSVPPDAWDNINKKEKKRRYPFFWWFLFAALITGGTVLYFNTKSPTNNSLESNQQDQHDKNTQSSTQSNTTDIKKTSDNDKLSDSINITIEEKSKTAQINTPGKANDKEVLDSITTSVHHNKNQNQFALQLPIAKIKSSALGSDDKMISKKRNIRKRIAGKYNQKIIAASTGADITTADQDSNVLNNDKNNNNIDSSNTNSAETALLKPATSPDTTNTLTAINQTNTIADSLKKAEKKDTANRQTKNTTSKKATTASQKIPLFIVDVSITPFSPMQRYQSPAYLKRSTIANGMQTIYTTNSIKTSLLFSSAFAIAIRKNISKKFIIGTGIEYELIKENITISGVDSNTSYSTIQRLADNNGSRSLINNTVSSTTFAKRTIYATNSYQFYKIPLFIQYNFISHPSYSVAFTGGVFFTIAAQYKNSIKGNVEPVYTSNSPADKSNSSALDVFGGIRYTKLIRKNFDVFLEPNFRYNVAAYSFKNAFINKDINKAGVSFGISYKIK